MNQISLQATHLYALAAGGRVPFTALKKLAESDPGTFWHIYEFAESVILEDFRAFTDILQAWSIDPRVFMGREVDRNSYEDVWKFLRVIVLLGESDAKIQVDFLTIYFESLRENQPELRAQHQMIYEVYEWLILLPELNMEHRLRERMSTYGAVETFESFNLGESSITIDENSEWIGLRQKMSENAAAFSLSDLDIPLRMKKAFAKRGLYTVGELLDIDRERVSVFRGIGPKSLDDIDAELRRVIRDIV